ncbi:hypothetical protein IQ255_05105 [Pleurocapsales cyanobacterium LEGE 10410]|nr:hypothetical protein [Pleurocapsales cyanobacterium LEGE 10410]
MNYTKANFKSLNTDNRPALTQYQRAWLWCQKFWQFSLFYGDYLAGLHSRNSK